MHEHVVKLAPIGLGGNAEIRYLDHLNMPTELVLLVL